MFPMTNKASNSFQATFAPPMRMLIYMDIGQEAHKGFVDNPGSRNNEETDASKHILWIDKDLGKRIDVITSSWRQKYSSS